MRSISGAVSDPDGLTSSTHYAGVRSATLDAAADLYGAGSVQSDAVTTARSAVGVS